MNKDHILFKMQLILLILISLLWNPNSQAPIYSQSKHFYVGQGSVINTKTKLTPDFTFTVPTPFTISTLAHRIPLHGVTGASHLKHQLNKSMYFWTTLQSITSTSFFFRIYTWADSVESFGFIYTSTIYFKYMVIDNSFPNKYICTQIPITNTFSITAGNYKSYSFLTTNFASPAPMALSSDTVFIHIFPYAKIDSNMGTPDNSFQMNFKFVVNSATNFSIQIHAKYPIAVLQFELKVLIYNKADFDLLYVKLDHIELSYNNLPTGSGSAISNTYTAAYAPSSTQIFYGISSYQFSKYQDLAFQFSIDPVPVGNVFTIKLTNLQPASSIPQLGLMVLLASQLRCPNSETLMDPAITICYTACPTQYFASPQQVGITGIKICQPCHYSCGQCSTIASNCTTCTADQNRQLLSNACVPLPHYFDAGVHIAQICDSNCYQCSISLTNCTSCNTGYYLSGNICVLCNSTYDPHCSTCNSTACTACDPLSGLILANNGSCISCSDYNAQCTSCDAAKCSECSSGYFINTTFGCSLCTFYSPNCISCNSTSCTKCQTGNFVNLTGGCSLCSFYGSSCIDCNSTSCIECQSGSVLNGTGGCTLCSSFNPGCTSCNITSCTQCPPQSFINSTGGCTFCSSYSTLCTDCISTGCTQCPTGYFVNSTGGCQTCGSKYNNQCLDCKNTQCITCQAGFQIDPTTFVCFAIKCGDGFWADLYEACDDGNLINGDGCDSNCQIQTDYICLLTDKTASGASFCKYNKNISVDFNYLSKSPSSNCVSLFFEISPANLQQWDQNTIKNLISPIQIVDQNTGLITTVPIQSLNVIFDSTSNSNKVQINVNYGQSNLQNSYLRFNIVPGNTNISTISHLPPNNNVYLKLSSSQSNNAVDLYGYSQDTYSFQKTVQTLSMVLGLLSLILIFAGLFIPVGKLVILESLAVVQSTFFSILMFQKIPPTFIGFKALMISNGYNDPNIIEGNSNLKTDIYQLMGLKQNVIPDYNISFILLFLLPISIGGIGLLVNKIKNKKPQNQINYQESNKSSKQPLTNETQKGQMSQKSLSSIILSIILFQTSFYGFAVCGYLSWVSVLYAISDKQMAGFVGAPLILVFWAGLGYCFIKSQYKKISLNQSTNNFKFGRNKDQKTQVLTDFGQFNQVPYQISKQQPSNEPIWLKKIYLAFVLQRLLSSIIIIFVRQGQSGIGSLLIIVIYSSLLVGLISIYKKFYNNSNSTLSISSHLYQNYTLRQVINFSTIIVIQIILFSVSMVIKNQGTYEAFVNNSVITKGVPTIMISLLFANIGFNSFLWIWQIKCSQLITKTKLIYSILTKNSLKQDLKNMDQSKNNSKFENEQAEVEDMMNSFMQTSPIFKRRNSPFLGATQKLANKQQFLQGLKLQKNIQVTNIQTQYKQIVNKLWEQI